MASRTFTLGADASWPSLTVDLLPPLNGMESLYPEIELFRGDDALINFVITQGGNAFDLTGYTVLYQAKAAIGDASFVFSKTATLTDAKNGKCQVSLTGADLPTAGTLQTQLYLTQAGATHTVMQVPLAVLPSV